MKFLILLLIFTFHAQATEVNDGAWLGTFANNKITDDYSFWMETQVRYNSDIGQTNQVLYRTGILHNSLGYLYGFIQGGLRKEHRFTLQHIDKFQGGFSSRARLEGRVLENNEGSSVRFRYLLRKELGTFKKFNIAIWDEVFLNLSRENWSGDRVDERNRLFIGLHRNFHNLRYEFGYLNQYVPRDHDSVMEHLFVIYFFI